MDKFEYLEALHDAAYIANMADSDEMRGDWQKPDHAQRHVGALLDLVKEVIGEGSLYETFLDCFGDFESFKAEAQRQEQEQEQNAPRTATPATLIDTKGSLELWHEKGDETHPEMYWVRFGPEFENAGRYGALDVARDWHEVDQVRLNGSQVMNVKRWAAQYA